ncbi:MAG: NUDIX domain-containing protein [Bacilli bacterium]|nr:NUDIX domain-containing protein [Bacilli bacterium]
MKLIATYDEKNYDSNWPLITREAVRGIIIKNNMIALVKSEKEGFYKFPGGGIEIGESHIETLHREIQEETGLKIKCDSINEFGIIREIRKSLFDRKEIFKQISYYYYVDVEEETTAQHLEDHEIELGYKLEWIDVNKAYEINSKLTNHYETKFILRETEILKLLRNF